MEKTENENQAYLSQNDVDGFKQYQEWMKEYEDLNARLDTAYAEESHAYASGYAENGEEYARQKEAEAQANVARLEGEMNTLKQQSVEKDIFDKKPDNVSEYAAPLTFENYLSDKAENGDASAKARLQDWQKTDMIILDNNLKYEDIPEALAYGKKNSNGHSVEIITEEDLAQKEEKEREVKAEEDIKNENKHDRFVQESEKVSKSIESEKEYENGGY